MVPDTTHQSARFGYVSVSIVTAHFPGHGRCWALWFLRLSILVTKVTEVNLNAGTSDIAGIKKQKVGIFFILT